MEDTVRRGGGVKSLVKWAKVAAALAPGAFLFYAFAGGGDSTQVPSRSFCSVYYGPDGLPDSGDGGVRALIDAGLLDPGQFSGWGEAGAYARNRCS